MKVYLNKSNIKQFIENINTEEKIILLYEDKGKLKFISQNMKYIIFTLNNEKLCKIDNGIDYYAVINHDNYVYSHNNGISYDDIKRNIIRYFIYKLLIISLFLVYIYIICIGINYY